MAFSEIEAAAAAVALAIFGSASAAVDRPRRDPPLPPVERDYRYPGARIVAVRRSPLPSLTVKYETADAFGRVRAFYATLARRKDPHPVASCTEAGDFCTFLISDGRFRVSPIVSSRSSGAVITMIFFAPAAEKASGRR